jgi:meso-butanediol dehydrogenase/(S,S)-butanediol dehydrogenase/diacetyl reductase
MGRSELQQEGLSIMAGRIEGRIALITGAASGIGRATAELFVKEGASVVVADKNGAEAAARELGARASAVTCDVSKTADVQAMVAATTKRHGRVDILINNAGYGIKGSVVETSEDDWDALMSVNVRGVYLGCKYVIPIMVKQGGGVIVNTASTTSRAGIKDRVAYVTSKGAVAAMTRAMALDHVDQNIRINCVAPGTIDGPYYEKMMTTVPDPVGWKNALKARQPMNRMGTPAEIAKAMLFLASDDSSYCTGSTLFADGGWTAR